MPRYFPPNRNTDPAATGPEPQSISALLHFRKAVFSRTSTLRSVIVCARHVVPANIANQLATPGFQTLRANRAETGGISSPSRGCVLRLSVRPGSSRIRRTTLCRSRFLFPDSFHSLPVIAHPPSNAKGQPPRNPSGLARPAANRFGRDAIQWRVSDAIGPTNSLLAFGSIPPISSTRNVAAAFCV